MNNIKKQVFLIFALFLCFININAQTSTWEKFYGLGTGYESSRINDESFYVCGNRGSVNSAIVLKLDKNGNEIWSRELENNTSYSYAKCIVTTEDNGCIVSGYAQGYKSIWKYDSEGNLLWLKNFEGNADVTKLLRMGNTIYAAASNIVYKFDSNGNMLWNKIFSNYSGLEIRDLSFQKSSNTLYCAGDFLYQYPVTLGFIGKIDADGNILAERTYKLMGKTTRYSYFKRYGSGFIAAGIAVDSNSFTPRVFFQRVNSNCDVEFTKIFPADNNELLSGFIIKDNNTLLFNTRTGDLNLQQQNKLKFFISDIDGNIIKSNSIASDYTKYINFGMSLSSNYSLFTGYKAASVYSSEYKILVLKIDSLLNYSTVNVSENSSSIAEKYILSQNYPNPFNPNTVINFQLKNSALINLSVFDANGRLIKILESGFRLAGNYSTNFSAEGLSSGVYYYSLYAGGVLMDTKKAVVMK